MCSERSLFDQASERRQVDPRVGQGNERSAPWLTVDGQVFEMPAFEVSVSVLGGVARAVLEAIPSGRTDRDIASQADRTIGKGFCNVDDFAVRMVLILVGTRGRRIRNRV